MAVKRRDGWYVINCRLDPWSYRNLLQRVSDLRDKDPSRPPTESSALRHILRRAKKLKTERNP